MKNYIKELLLEDNENMTEEVIKYYVDEIIKELKCCRITQKSVEEISLHEFKQGRTTFKGVYVEYFILLVRVIYNGDFEHNFQIYREGE